MLRDYAAVDVAIESYFLGKFNPTKIRYFKVLLILRYFDVRVFALTVSLIFFNYYLIATNIKRARGCRFLFELRETYLTSRAFLVTFNKIAKGSYKISNL